MSTTYTHIRPPAVAGRFYEGDPARCAVVAAKFCEPGPVAAAVPAVLHGAIVPHAGWICSGRVAGETLALLARRTAARTVVLTGSVHTMAIWAPALESADAWQTPMGNVAVDHQLRAALSRIDGFAAMDMAHEREHSLEVELPFMIQSMGTRVKIVPCLIPPHEKAVAWGEAIGAVLSTWHEPAVMICSTDFTHYGPNYGFTPRGDGLTGIRWAHEENDRALLNRIAKMEAEPIVAEVAATHSACGAGAIAATVACCRKLGSTAGYLLRHTNSQDVLAPLGYADGRNSVGYAGVVFG